MSCIQRHPRTRVCTRLRLVHTLVLGCAVCSSSLSTSAISFTSAACMHIHAIHTMQMHGTFSPFPLLPGQNPKSREYPAETGTVGMYAIILCSDVCICMYAYTWYAASYGHPPRYRGTRMREGCGYSLYCGRVTYPL